MPKIYCQSYLVGDDLAVGSHWWQKPRHISMIWITIVAIGLFLVLAFRSRRRPDPVQNVPHACGASNPKDANYCRRCGEQLLLPLVDMIDDDPKDQEN